ncbi:hypothetical protein [Acetobacterium wieringae]|uniref:hypothetical protein n=1 Tax=Acetobacterium wieringae TaxID=52694 RepID=UPI00203371B5|nr:hypothetical protein [Acetobacterium wieringae]URN85857.1 hypothetical protein CHL1_001531 [Acetobacterium wieringae]
MKVFLVTADNHDKDEHDSVVIIAKTEEKVLEIIAQENKKDKHFPLFYNHQLPLTIKEVDLSEECILLKSFNEG